ncbi:hypothetical protein JCM16776_0308 [Leptotrichia shahii]|uniref:Uncharacterized protein n=1 Tax=Leptotrichia shahii TaxID=157691 RepID=A0A510JP18_9FUSO|nr:hypothetical protein [Leptotrichia shahii]BBM40095.1 hypothetical protein JCM16776_0308 [Leptotrichia shahii]
MRKNLLKSKMSLHEDNNKTLAHKLKITLSAFSRKINGTSNFTIEEMKFIRKEYELSDVEFLDIFLIINLLFGKIIFKVKEKMEVMEGNNNKTIKILIGVIIGLSAIILFSGIFYILNMQGKIAKLETEQEERLKRQMESQNMASVQTMQSAQTQQQSNINRKEETGTRSQQSQTITSNGINITKEEGVYIRVNFNTFFGSNEVCHNIGRNHVNFPAIYSGNRPDLSAALLRFIKKSDSSFVNNSNLSDEDNVMNWYTANCVRYNAIGSENSKTLRYFYNYVSNF